MNSKSQESQSWGAPPGILPKPMTNMHTLNNTEMKSLDVTWSQALVQSTTSASFPVTTFCTCSPTSAQELHPNSTKDTAFTYPSSYCSQSLEKATDTLLSWQVSQWKIIISAKNPKCFKKILMMTELKANQNDALNSSLSTQPTLTCFGLQTLQERDSPPSYIL